MKSNKTPLKKISFNRFAFTKQTYCLITMVALFFLFSEISDANGQVILGTLPKGASGNGQIFKVNADGTEFQNTPFKGSNSNGCIKILKHSNGKMYGISDSGGVGEDGILFELDPETGEVEQKISFYFYDNGRPGGDLIEYNGKIYMNVDGLVPGISSFDPLTNIYKKEIMLPMRCNGMVLVDGRFYGMTPNGGMQRAGSIFEFNPQTYTYTVLVQLNHTTTGRYPDAGLTYVDGKLYGLVKEGGKYGWGTLVEYDLALHVFKKKIDFHKNTTGGTPAGELSYLNGKLYGVTYAGGNYNKGVLFEYNPVTESISRVLDFSPEHPLTFLEEYNGVLWGTTSNGGSNNEGTLFSFDPVNISWSTLIDFDLETTGGGPSAYLHDNGKVWGFSSRGGEGNGGVIFELDITSNQSAIRYSFNYFPQGKKPSYIAEISNKFYGLTAAGGTFNRGVLFEFDQVTATINPLHNFNCSDCDSENYYGFPTGKILASQDKLYGITYVGEGVGVGVLFQYDLTQNSYVTLYEFRDPEKGRGPLPNLEFIDGKFYGTTTSGGANDQGVLYEYNPITSMLIVKQSLDESTTGINHRFTKVGNMLYGLSNLETPGGKAILSSYNPLTNTLTNILELQKPSTSDLISQSNKVFGITNSYYNPTPPYTSFNQTVFEFDLLTQQYKELYVFKYSESSDGRLRKVGSKLYGLEMNEASFFEFNLDDKKYRRLTTVSIGQDYYDQINSFIIKDAGSETSVPVITEMIEFTQGKRRDGATISFDRSNPEKALYYADSFDDSYSPNNFVALGFGGSIILGFDLPLCNKDGYDLHIFETSYGNPSFYDYPEQAEVFVSEGGLDWISLGRTNPANPETGCAAKLDSDFDIESSGLECINFVKLVDVTNRFAKRRDKNTCIETSSLVFNNAADGFDLDAIETIRGINQHNSSGRIPHYTKSGIVNIDAGHTNASLFPNPVSKTLVIDLSEETEMAIMSDELTFEIIDLNGKVVQQTSDALDDSWTITDDVSQLNNGFYVARVSTGNVRRNYKFMKN